MIELTQQSRKHIKSKSTDTTITEKYKYSLTELLIDPFAISSIEDVGCDCELSEKTRITLNNGETFFVMESVADIKFILEESAMED